MADLGMERGSRKAGIRLVDFRTVVYNFVFLC